MATESSFTAFSLPNLEMSRTTEKADNSTRNVPPTWEDLNRPYMTAVNTTRDIGDPAVVTLGLAGNSLTILIMRRLPPSIYSVFFTIMAVSDQLVLIVGPLERLLHGTADVVYIKAQSNWLCKINRMICHTTLPLSAWMLVSLTMLRAVSVLCPFHVRAVWTKGKSGVLAGIVTIVTILLNCYVLGHYAVVDGHCGMYLVEMYWSWTSLAELCCLPFIMLATSNGVLLWSLFRSDRQNKLGPIQQTTEDSRYHKVSSLTVALIATSTSSVLLTTPFIVYQFANSYVDWDNPVVNGQYSVLFDASYMLVFVNSADKFYIYCLTGRAFRAELLKLALEVYSLCCSKKRVNS